MPARTLPVLLAALALFGVAPATASAAFPGNNGRIAFTRGLPGSTDIFTVARDGGAATQLTATAGADEDPAWSPDGSRIAFTSARGGSLDVWVMRADGSQPVRLTSNPAADRQPAWSPDGTRIAFTSDRDGDDDVYVMNADGGAQLNVSNTAIQTIGGETVTRADGTTFTLPTFRFGHESQPAWSPAGRIAFTTDRDRNAEVYAMNADGSGQTNLTRSNGQDSAPSWSPDGGRFAHTMAALPADGVGVRNADGSGFVNYAGAGTWDEAPAFSPDGLRLTFRGITRATGPGIYTMKTDRSSLTRVTTGTTDTDPDWQPCAACSPQVDPVVAPPAPAPTTPTRPGGGTGSGSKGAPAPAWAPTAPGGGIIQLGSPSSGGDGGSPQAAASTRPRALTIGAQVTSVVAGDTIKVRLFNASRKTATVRLLGIATSRFGRGGCGSAASRGALRALLFDAKGRGRTLILKTDPAVGTFDRAGRLQAYVRTRTTNVAVQNMMLAGGWAKATAGAHASRPRYRRLEQGARSARRGLWKRCGLR